MSDGPLSGDPQGHMKLAFLLAEVVGTLESAGAPHEGIQQLNDCFTEFRRCDRAELAACGNKLGEHREDAAQGYTELVSRVADLHSRIDKQIRWQACDNDSPF